jgi:GNAT superfamily N-acetyltransferase
MPITQLGPAADDAIRACHGLMAAATRADDPAEPPQSVHACKTSLFGAWSGSPVEAWYVPDGETGAAAVCRIEFPDLENPHWAFADIVVHPGRRRGGLGTALLSHAAERAAASGRTLLGAQAQEGSTGETFAAHAGATFGKADVRRIQDLRKVPGATLDELRESAEKAAAGYSLVRWEGITPDEFLDQVANLVNALNDAPHDAGVEPHIWDARRIRERQDAMITAYGQRRYSVAAVHEATGVMAALSAVSVDPAIPEWGHQAVTMVTRPHRGHRLGLLVKVAMMDRLAAAEPRVEKIVTWNAAANDHMIGINDALRYEVAGRPYRSVRLPVAKILSSLTSQVTA